MCYLYPSTPSRRRLRRRCLPAKRLETNPFSRLTLFADSKLFHEQPTECRLAEISDIGPMNISTLADLSFSSFLKEHGAAARLEVGNSYFRIRRGESGWKWRAEEPRVKGVVGFARKGERVNVWSRIITLRLLFIRGTFFRRFNRQIWFKSSVVLDALLENVLRLKSREIYGLRRRLWGRCFHTLKEEKRSNRQNRQTTIESAKLFIETFRPLNNSSRNWTSSVSSHEIVNCFQHH